MLSDSLITESFRSRNEISFLFLSMLSYYIFILLDFIPTSIIFSIAMCRSMSQRKGNRLSKFQAGGSGSGVLDLPPVARMKMTSQEVRDKLRILRSYKGDFNSQRCNYFAVWSSASNHFLIRHCASLRDQGMEAEADTANICEEVPFQNQHLVPWH